MVLDSGAVVAGNATTVNGSVKMNHARILGNLATANGDLFIEHHSVVNGDIVIKGKNSKNEKRKVEIFLKDGSEINGKIENKAQSTEVVVHALGGSKINGDVIGAEIVYE